MSKIGEFANISGIAEDWLYYINKDQKACRIKLDGSEKQEY